MALSEEKKQNTDVTIDLTSELEHAVGVSNLAYEVGQELGLSEAVCRELAIAGMLHDIGKLKLAGYINGQEEDPLTVEELKYMRMHSMLSYEELKGKGYSEFILETILYHHENYDGTGYPSNLQGKEIPLGARILRVCDVFCALRSDRPYRKALEVDNILQTMIEEIKNYDMEIFLAFQRVVHRMNEEDKKGETEICR